MNYIIYDIECTCWDDHLEKNEQEIIEIGAVLLDSYGELVGTFNKFVKPILHPRLSPYCRDLTSIEQFQIDRSDHFPEVIEQFQDWAEIFDEDYVLCSWGSFDKKMMIKDCELHDMESDWIEHHINVKRQYYEFKGLRRPRGLKSSVEKEGFEFTGIHHRGISDAENLAKIFIKYFDEWVI